MTEKTVLFRWKAIFYVCTVALAVLIVFFVSTGEITVSKFTLKMFETLSFKTKPVPETKSACQAFDELSSDVNKTTRKNCSVAVFTSSKQTDYYSRNSSCPVCTSALFKEYYRTHGAFISDGYWDVLASGNTIRSATFRPSFCSFTRRDLDSNFIKECFSRRRVQKIVMLGDSNGRMTFFGFNAVLASLGIKPCNLIKAETDSFFSNITYYLPPGMQIPPGYADTYRRSCHSCNARQFHCFYDNKDLSGRNQNTSLVLEYLPLNLIIDNSLRIHNPIAGFKPTNISQEFIFRDYLVRDGQPDVVIIVTPFVHEVRAGLGRHGKVGLKGIIRKLVTILEEHLPRSTQVYWLPGQYIFGAKELAEVNLCNHDLYEVLKADFGAVGNRMHGTLDWLSLLCPLVELSKKGDPYHMHPKWYEVVGKHLLELLCN